MGLQLTLFRAHETLIKCVALMVALSLAAACGAPQVYANAKGIKIIGDMPIYVGGQSADVWANR